jgi:hypothetical protein
MGYGQAETSTSRSPLEGRTHQKTWKSSAGKEESGRTAEENKIRKTIIDLVDS